MNRHSTRLLVVSLASAAMLLISGASAQASWLPPGATSSNWHCGAYNKNLAPLWFQECIVVTPTASGASVQSVMAVSNALSPWSAGLDGSTTTFSSGSVLSDTECGHTVIAAGARRWCYGKTTPVIHGKSVQGKGWVTFDGWEYSEVALSPTWQT